MYRKDFDEIRMILLREIKKLNSVYKIKLLYIFGSYAKGTNNDDSDIDIAVLLEEGYSPLHKVSLLGNLSDTLKTDNIDLVILNSAHSVLKHQVIKYGKIVYNESEESRILYEVRVLKEYMDMEYFRKTQMHYISEWISKEMEAAK
jgi:uncharacterized protein